MKKVKQEQDKTDDKFHAVRWAVQ